MEITEKIARKVLETVDAGLVGGVGRPAPGQMCVEAAVCYALGLPHGDDPECVSRALRTLKITLNDAVWSSDSARAKGLRRLALAQLGSRGTLNDAEFVKRCAELVIRKQLPAALRAAATVQTTEKHREAVIAAAERCEREGSRTAVKATYDATYDAAYGAARSAVYTAYVAAEVGDTVLAEFAEDVVQILVEMKAPGCQWLAMTE
jgi:hypothetical protein